MPFIVGKQDATAKFASSFVPQSAFGLWMRNAVTRAMAIPGVAKLAMGGMLRDDLELPSYPASGRRAAASSEQTIQTPAVS